MDQALEQYKMIIDILIRSEYNEKEDIDAYNDFSSTIDYSIDHIKKYSIPKFMLFKYVEISPQLR